MEFFLEMLFTAIVALLFSFLVAKLVSVVMAGNVDGGGNDPTSDQEEKPEITAGGGFLTEEIRFGMKMDARVLESESKFRVVDQNVEPVDLFVTGADRVVELEEAVTENGKVRAQGEELVVQTLEAESTVAIPPENVLAKEMVVPRQDEHNDSAEEKSGETDGEPEKLIVHTREAESTTSVSPENVVTEEILIRGQEERSESTERRIACVESEESGHVSVAESEEVRVEESNTIVESESMETSKETEELSIEEDDDWEGIERSELEKAFTAAAKCVEESVKAEEIGAEAKMRLYGLHKIATEGSCREAQPMAVMVSARAKWNAWHALGNVSQEEAMEQYLALISKEIPALMNIGYTVGKIPKMETSAVLLPNSGILEDPTTLDTLAVASDKNGEM